VHAAARLLKSSAGLKVLLDDLLDFDRRKLGLGITISPAPVDLAEAFLAEIDQLRVALPVDPLRSKSTAQPTHADR
jgi:signal transduction histidine kinase